MRLPRGRVPVLIEPNQPPFVIGKSRLLRSGSDVGIISTGLLTGAALEAATVMESQGISVGVLHVPSIKPFDNDGVAEFSSQVNQIITAENHVTDGGLGTLVTQALYRAQLLKPLRHIGLPDKYIECGSVPYLQAKYKITAADIVDACRG